MGKLFYCHMCGKILEKEEVHNITIRDVETHKELKLYDTCKDCAKKVLNLKFKPEKLTPSQRKKPVFASIIIKRPFTKPSKEKLVYDVLPYQLEKIKALELDINELKLTYKSGARIYTEFQVQKWMDLDDKNLIEGMMMVYKHQTEDEKKSRETKYANSVGFNKPDASFMTGMGRIFECRGFDYTEAQLARIKKTMPKYARQVTLYVNAENKILEGV